MFSELRDPCESGQAVSGWCPAGGSGAGGAGQQPRPRRLQQVRSPEPDGDGTLRPHGEPLWGALPSALTLGRQWGQSRPYHPVRHQPGAAWRCRPHGQRALHRLLLAGAGGAPSPGRPVQVSHLCHAQLRRSLPEPGRDPPGGAGQPGAGAGLQQVPHRQLPDGRAGFRLRSLRR